MSKDTAEANEETKQFITQCFRWLSHSANYKNTVVKKQIFWLCSTARKIEPFSGHRGPEYCRQTKKEIKN